MTLSYHMEELHEDSFFSNSGNVVLVVLVLIALALSYFLYQRATETALPSSDDAPQMEDNPAPGAGAATPKEDETLNKDIKTMAVDTEMLTIGEKCALSPAVLKTQLGKEVTLKNIDTVPHAIKFTESLSFKVSANSSVAIPITFDGKAGLYGYSCDQDPSVVGFFQILK